MVKFTRSFGCAAFVGSCLGGFVRIALCVEERSSWDVTAFLNRGGETINGERANSSTITTTLVDTASFDRRYPIKASASHADAE